MAKMHPDELETEPSLVRRLLAAQFPQWADLPVTPVPHAGTDNALFRLGEDLVARLPRREGSQQQSEKDYRWLPVLAPHLPLAISEPLALGRPGEGYPFFWLICRWLPGEPPGLDALADPIQAAKDLAAFIVALHAIDASDGPPAGRHNFLRGVPLAGRDAGVRPCIPAWVGRVDTDALTAAWDAALAAPPWDGPGVWLHGDLQPGNLLAKDGRLSAVIDFGCLGVGDPASDLLPAWNFFRGESRAAFRRALDVDDVTWARGRGWALIAIQALPYYRDTNPTIVQSALRTIEAVLADQT